MADVQLTDIFQDKNVPILNPAANFAELDARSKTVLLEGTLCSVIDTNNLYRYNGTAWVTYQSTLNLEPLFENGNTPILNPATNFAELDARSKTNIVTGSLCWVIDTSILYEYNGTAWVNHEDTLSWVSLSAASANWGSANAYIGKCHNNQFGVLRGYFISQIDQNSGAVFTFPSGYEPLNTALRVPCGALLGGSSYIIYNGRFTWSGGGTTLAVTQPGVVAGDQVFYSINYRGATTPFPAVQEAVPSTDTITFRLSGADADNDIIISWMVIKTLSNTPDSLLCSSNSMTAGRKYNTSDRVYIDGIIYPLAV
jgi:hypothetical protein